MTRFKVLRIGTVLVGVVLVASGAVGELRYGGICTVGIGKIWGTCPLGFAQRSLAAREILPQWPTVLVVVGSIVLLGRVFCAWFCPTVVLRRVFFENVKLKPKRMTMPGGITWSSLSPYAVLGGVLLASYVFRFPVFCLFCPIGIFFAFIYAIGQYFSVDTVSMGLLIFPIALIVELWVLKKWCRTICPLGALLSIIGNFNRILVPTPREGGCLTMKGANCNVCEQVCPEEIQLSNTKRKFWLQSCTKCLECYERCPGKAVKIPLIK